VVFAGTPEVAVPALEAIAASSHDLVGVVTRPDAPAGRGRKLVASPVAQRAEELGVPVLKPEHPKDPDFQAQLAELRPDCCPVVAYGALLPQSALDIPEHGWVNLHFSLLPAWRGAAPVQHAIWAGDEVTGTGVKVDAGSRLARHRRRPAHQARRQRRRPPGGDPRRDRGRLARGAGATGRGHQLRAEDPRRGRRDRLDRAGAAVDRRIQACTLGRARGRHAPAAGQDRPVALTENRELEPGVLEVTKNALFVGTATDPVRLAEVKAFGKKQMQAADWARGARVASGERFGG
jgi:methionyl-tRNA formyltransferase